MVTACPSIVLLFSGKRKCGKDTLTDILFNAIGGKRAVVIKISAPIKSHFAKNRGLDLQELMGDGEYKEIYRKEMIKWGEDIRNKDHGYFCRAAIELFEAEKKPIWIVSDIRRRTDIQWFSENFKDAVITYRIIAPDEIRKSRGWVFTEGIDDAASECDLDAVDNWDCVIENDGSLDNLKSKIDCIVNTVNEKLLKIGRK